MTDPSPATTFSHLDATVVLSRQIAADPAFNLTLEDLQKAMEPSRYTGRAKEQTEAFIANVVQPVLDAHKDLLGVKVEINV